MADMTRDLLDDRINHGKTVGKDHSGILLHVFGQRQFLRQVAARGGAQVLAHQRDVGVAQRLVAGGNAHGNAAGQVGGILLVDVIIADHVEASHLAGQLDDILEGLEQFEGGALLILDHLGDAQVDQLLLFRIGEAFDEIVTGENLGKIVILEKLLVGTGQADGSTAVNHRGPARRPGRLTLSRLRRCCGVGGSWSGRSRTAGRRGRLRCCRSLGRRRGG